MGEHQRLGRCRCGQVELMLSGSPIASLICHCDDCQAGSARLATLPGNGPVMDAAGGTAHVSWRKDRMRVVRGQALLREIRLRANSATVRLYAACCGTPMVMIFEDARHWVAIYRDCLDAPVLDPQWRIMTRFIPEAVQVPEDIPVFRRIPLPMVWRLLSSRIAMAFGRQ